MKCMRGHECRLVKPSIIRGHFRSCQCALCPSEIPRLALRHQCWRCGYHVCYDCAERFQLCDSNSESDGSSSCGSFGSIDAAKNVMQGYVKKLRRRLERKQRRREVRVAISKFYDISTPATGQLQTRGHSRRRDAVAEDCSFAVYSNAAMLVQPSPDVSIGAECAGGNYDEGIAVAEGVLRRVGQLLEIVAAESAMHADCLDSHWEPQLPGSNDSARRCIIFAWLLGECDVMGQLEVLCHAASRVLQTQPMVSEVAVPARVFGDIHGQLRDLLLFFHVYGWPCLEGETGKDSHAMSYVFNGDWVDRGSHQLEVVVLLLAMKVAYPSRVWLNRGNHEDSAQNMKTTREGNLGFDVACERALGRERGWIAFETIHRTFEWLPLAAKIGGRILVLHGGLGNGEWTLHDLSQVQRPLTSGDLATALSGSVYNILWSDPLLANRTFPEETFGAHQSPRSKKNKVMLAFGRDVTEKFCAREQLSLIVRSHQFKKSGKGYEFMHDGWLMRVFSARNYTGKHANDGGHLLIGWAANSPDTLLVRPQVIERFRTIYRAMSLGSDVSVTEPYCPQAHLMHIVKPELPAGCLSIPLRPKVVKVECHECGETNLQVNRYYTCRGCINFSLCLQCARDANNVFEENGELNDSSDSDADTSNTSANLYRLPTLLTSHATSRPVKVL